MPFILYMGLISKSWQTEQAIVSAETGVEVHIMGNAADSGASGDCPSSPCLPIRFHIGCCIWYQL